MEVHLEGMGIQGCLLAHTLARYGVRFSWHDTDAAHTAWKASTGAIYPADSTNHGPDRETWKVWKAWYEAGHFNPAHLEKSAGLVFLTKNPPHKGSYDWTPLLGDLKLGADPSFHLNAQTFVLDTRKRFHSQRREGNGFGHTYIVTHSWGARFHHAYWGWTRLVKLKHPSVSVGGRPAFYLRPNRFTMAYAYPVPGTDWYYAGSNILKQAAGKLKELNPGPKYRLWKQNFTELALGEVQVVEEGAYLTGWRPAGAEDDTAWVRRKSGVLTLRPLWNSGIRHFPAQWAGVAAQLGLVA